MEKLQNTINNHIHESQKVSPCPAGDHKAKMNRQCINMTDKNETQITSRIRKRSTPLERLVRKLLEGLIVFYGTNINLISNVDQVK